MHAISLLDMAFFLFIDESGQDRKDSPYEVLAGIVIQDHDLWNLIRLTHDVEAECFQGRYRDEGREIKARTFLNRKTFRLASQLPPIPEREGATLARQALNNGERVTKKQLTALAQAKLDCVEKVLNLCNAFRCKIFASVVANNTSIDRNRELLRKDYVYLFERFYYFLEDQGSQPNGIIVFDELEKSMSHILLNQMDKYFKKTSKGCIRSNLIIPEPFFVHSDLSTGIQWIDFVAYIISWGFRIEHKLEKPARSELNRYLEIIKSMRYRTTRELLGKEITVWSVTVV